MEIGTGNLYYFVLILGTFLVALLLTLILRKSLNIFILKYSARLEADPTNFTFLKNSVSFIIFGIAITFIFFKIPYLKALGTALFAGAGIFAAIIGFASQKAFSNIVSGIFILIFKPFRVNDTIEVGDGKMGVVEEITLRHTVIRNYENRRIIIPNGKISDETIINSNILDEKIRQHIVFGISYDSNVDKAISIIREEAMQHPFYIDKRSAAEKKADHPSVIVRLIELADFSVQLKAYVWSEGTDNAFVMKCDLLKTVFERFNKEGIEIPFPYRTIVYKNDMNQQDELKNAEKS